MCVFDFGMSSSLLNEESIADDILVIKDKLHPDWACLAMCEGDFLIVYTTRDMTIVRIRLYIDILLDLWHCRKISFG
jgi:hypothetical protein